MFKHIKIFQCSIFIPEFNWAFFYSTGGQLIATMKDFQRLRPLQDYVVMMKEEYIILYFFSVRFSAEFEGLPEI